jgi:hypothetical protein
VFDRLNSHLHEDARHHLPDALARIETKGRQFIVEEVDFGQPIGKTICVAARPGDKIVYAKRPKRWGPSRFVLNREPEECSSIVVILKKAEENGGYVLITAFIGHLSEPEPWDRRYFNQQANPAEAAEKSRDFWENHALIWGAEDVIENTVTTECPW